MSKLKHNVNLIFFTTDEENNKQYVLSTNKDQIEIPYLTLNEETKKDVENTVGEYIRQNLLFLNDIELMSQLISLNEEILSEDPETVSSVYGFVIPKETQINKDVVEWFEFNLYDENNKYASLFIDVIRSLV